MKKIAVVYHSGFGHTEVVAKSVVKGIESSGAEALLLNVESLSEDLDELSNVDGIIFGSPTYMGSVSAPFKAFMDKSSKVWFTQGWKNKIAAGFTNSGSLSGDKFNSLIQLVTFASQHGMIWVPLGEMNHSSPAGNADPDAVNRIGSYLGVMTQSNNEAPEFTPPIGDHKTAEILGQRVAEIAKSFNL